MSWQITLFIQIFFSSFMTLFTRRLSLISKKSFFVVMAVSFTTIAVVGWLYGYLFGDGHVVFPSLHAWPFLLTEGFLIPSSALVQYKLIKYLGATNMAIVAVLNTFVVALLGIIFLHNTVNAAFAFGALFILSGVVIALKLQPDTAHHVHTKLEKKVFLTVIGALFYGFGMFAEKKAINIMGVWHYSEFGWTMQAIGAITFLIILGRSELRSLSTKITLSSSFLGLLTSSAGGLYIYALSKGSLSRTIIATSGKVVVVMILAAILLKEKNNLKQRVYAFVCTAIGISLVILG